MAAREKTSIEVLFMLYWCQAPNLHQSYPRFTEGFALARTDRRYRMHHLAFLTRVGQCVFYGTGSNCSSSKV